MSGNTILKILDEAAEDFEFPMRDNMSYYPSTINMNVFLYNDNWLIVFQELSYSLKDKIFVNTLFGYGSALEYNGVQDEIEVIKEVDDFSFFSEETGAFQIDLMRFDVEINQSLESFSFSKDDYVEADIDIKDVKTPREAIFLRMISISKSSSLFLTKEELGKYFTIDVDLLDFLEIENWQHPDIGNDELPSDILCFKNLAEAIEKKDVTFYNCSEELFNTHWSNWEWYKEY